MLILWTMITLICKREQITLCFMFRMYWKCVIFSCELQKPITFASIKFKALEKQLTKIYKMKRARRKEKSVSLFGPLCLPWDFFHFTNSFQWLSNWKMEMLLLPSISAAASWQQSNFLSSGINGIEQYIRIKKPVIAGLPVCHLSRKSSPPDLSRVLSELIMSSIKSKKNPEKIPVFSIVQHSQKIKEISAESP